MAETSWPMPGSDDEVTDTQYEKLVGGYVPDGLLRGTPSDPTVVYADGTGALRVRAGKSAVLGGFGWSSGDVDVAPLDAITPNPSDSPRIDLAVLRLDRSAPAPDAWSVRVRIVVGTPGSNAPAVTHNEGDTGVWEMPLAQFTVAAGSSIVAAGSMRDRSWYLAPGGLILCSPTSRPPAQPGLKILELGGDTPTEWVATGYTDSSWIVIGSYTDWLPITPTGKGWYTDRGALPRICRIGKLVVLRPGELQRSSSLAAQAQSPVYQVPEGFRTSLYTGIPAYQDGSHQCDVVLTPMNPNDGTPANTVMVRGHDTTISAGNSLRLKQICYPAEG